METWNREELYAEVWDQPLTKLMTKYGISAVALGKVCRKLQIPLPGRGYWTKKDFGKPVERAPLPVVTDLPVIRRTEFSPREASSQLGPTPEPTDSEWLRIKEVESRVIRVAGEPNYHKLVASTLKCLRGAKSDDRGMLQPQPGARILDVRVSKSSLKRALNIFNAVIVALESEGFPVTITEEWHGTEAKVFGRLVQFTVVEKLKQKDRRVVTEHSWTRTIIDYEPSGKLEFRVGSSGWSPRRTLRDSKKHQIENMIPEAVGAIMREGRNLRIREERWKQEEIVRQQRAKELAVLAEQIREEEKKLKQLDGWVDSWQRTKLMREFICELEKKWADEGRDLAPESSSGQRITWMKQQADRMDPFVADKPSSVLDRKSELNAWYGGIG